MGLAVRYEFDAVSKRGHAVVFDPVLEEAGLTESESGSRSKAEGGAPPRQQDGVSQAQAREVRASLGF